MNAHPNKPAPRSRRLQPAQSAPGHSPSPHEQHHRLPRESYRGQVTVAFTGCVAGQTPLFVAGDVVAVFVSLLKAAAEKHACGVSIYCFMPDHVHLLLSGQHEFSDAWSALTLFKQRTGFWLGRHCPGIRWQKDFYDHIIRRTEDLGAQVRYIAGNPVRRGLVKDWREYPFTGAIGVDLNALISSTITL
jgi:putative transposase